MRRRPQTRSSSAGLAANAEAWKRGEKKVEGVRYARLRVAPYRVWCLDDWPSLDSVTIEANSVRFGEQRNSTREPTKPKTTTSQENR